MTFLRKHPTLRRACLAAAALIAVGALITTSTSGIGKAAADTGDSRANDGFVVTWVGERIVARNTATQRLTCPSQVFSETLECAIDQLPEPRTHQGLVSVVGEFELTETIDLPSYTTLDLNQATITRADAMNAIMFRNRDADGNTAIEIRGGRIVGNKDGQTVKPPYPGPGANSQYVVYFTKVSRATITGTTFFDCGPDATIHADDSTEITVDSITMEQNFYETIWLHGGGRHQVINSRFVDVGTAVATATSEDVLISGNTIINSVRISALSINGLRNHVFHNTITGGTGSGITLGHPPNANGDVLNASGSIISDNMITGGTGNAIHALNGSSQTGIRITGNVLRDVTDGIAIGPGRNEYGGVRDFVIDGNTIMGSGRTCVRLQGSTPANTPGTTTLANVSITNNVCADPDREGYVDDRYPEGLFNSGIAVYSTYEGVISDVWVSGNRVYSTGENEHHWYGVYLFNTAGSYVKGNDLRASRGPVQMVGNNPGATVQTDPREG